MIFIFFLSPHQKTNFFLIACLCFSLVADIFISLGIVTQCPLFLLMSSCIVRLLPVILKTHRWQSTLSGVNSKFRSCWYGYAFHPECPLHICGPYSLLYMVPSPALPQMPIGRHCACQLLEYTESGSSESTDCPFLWYLFPFPSC